MKQDSKEMDRDKAALHVALGVAGAVSLLAAAVVAVALTVTPPPAPAAGEQAVADARTTMVVAQH